MKMGSKIDGKSMKSRGCVADAILVRSGGQKAKKEQFFGTPFCNHFRPKIQKNGKKNEYGHRALSRSAPRTQKKRFLRGSENVLFFGWFFHWKWPTFGGHFQWKNHPKIHADFEPEKVMIFDEKSMQKLLEFLHCFFICLVRFRKVPNAKYCIKTNEFSMFLGFAQFGKQSKNSKTNSKKQARKSNEINMNKSLKNH